MTLKAFTFRLDPDLIAKIDAARGDVNRTRWVQRALESALGSPGQGPATAGARGSSPSPVSSRAPAEKGPEVDLPSVDRDAPPVPSPAPSRPAHVANVLGSPVRKVPSLKETWGR